MRLELRLVSSPPPPARHGRSSTSPTATGPGSSPSGIVVSADEKRSIKTIWAEHEKKRKRQSSANASPPLSVDADGFKVPPKPSSPSASNASGKRPVKRRRTSSANEDDLLPTPPASSLIGAPAAEDENNNDEVDEDDEPPVSVWANPKWTSFEDEILRKGIRQGWTSKKIVKELGPRTIRTANAVRGRKLSLKLKESGRAVSRVPSTASPRPQNSREKGKAKAATRSNIPSTPNHTPQSQETSPAMPSTEDAEDQERSTTPQLASSPPIVEPVIERARSPVVLISRKSTGKLRMPTRVTRVPSSVAKSAVNARSPPDPFPMPQQQERCPRKRQPQQHVSPTLSEQPTSAQPISSPTPDSTASQGDQSEHMPSPTLGAAVSQGFEPGRGAPASYRDLHGVCGQRDHELKPRRTWSCSRHDLLRGLPADFVDNLIRVRARTENITKQRAREDTAADNAFWNATLNENDALVDEIQRFRRIKKHQRAVEDGKPPPGRRNRLEGLPMLQASDHESVDESFGPDDDFAVPTWGSDEEHVRDNDMYVSDDDEEDLPGEDDEDDEDNEDMIKDRPFVEVEEEPPREPSVHTPAHDSKATVTDTAAVTASPPPRHHCHADGERVVPASYRDLPAPAPRASTSSGSSMFEGRWGEILKKAQHVPPAPKRQPPPKVYSTDELHSLYFGESSEEEVKVKVEEEEDDEDDEGSSISCESD